MTAQISEKLFINGERVPLLTNPLDLYFDLGGKGPRFQSTSTALWRGYVGTWELTNNRLYLIALVGTLEDGSEALLKNIFPDFADRVFAHWYSGILRIPRGKMIHYRHMGYGSKFERDQFITIYNGVVTSERVVENGVAPPDAREGYSIGAMTTWPAENKKVDS